jgi:hypothetical protein
MGLNPFVLAAGESQTPNVAKDATESDRASKRVGANSRDWNCPTSRPYRFNFQF